MKNAHTSLHNPQIKSTTPVIHGMGIHSGHPPDYVARTPRFHGYLLMCFRNRFFCTTVDGPAEGGPGDCIIHSPRYPQAHGTAAGYSEGFTNDWIEVYAPRMPALLKAYDLPVNTIIHTGLPGLMEPFLTKIQFERYDQAPYAARAICAQLELMLLEMARQSQALRAKGPLSHADIEIRHRLQGVRVQIHQRFQQPWTIAEMAQLANLSPGYFATRYSDFFGISPIDDLILRRMEAAQRWLQQDQYEIATIAERAGFTDVYYFSRTFKKRVGCPPGVYRKRFLASAQ